MDEAAAALDALEPAVALTYAEAGGWGRALALECRRRGIPLAGLQHGFIYRHWLNYRHEPDEMLAGSAINPPTPGSRVPRSTLLFDDYARAPSRDGRALSAGVARRHRQPAARRASVRGAARADA